MLTERICWKFVFVLWYMCNVSLADMFTLPGPSLLALDTVLRVQVLTWYKNKISLSYSLMS